MLEIYTVALFGHRHIDEFSFVQESVGRLVTDLILNKTYVEFLVGRDGEFDQIVSSEIRNAKRKYIESNNALVCVLPYMKAQYINNKESFECYYDEIEICGESANVFPKAAIQVRNKSMVDRADLCVFYVKHRVGGAWQTMQYAKAQGKCMINIAEKHLDA